MHSELTAASSARRLQEISASSFALLVPHFRHCSPCLSALAPFSVAQQTGQASLAGQVHDKTSAAINGARVTLRALSGACTASVLRGPEGQFSISGLAPGTYRVTAVHPGFEEQTRTVALHADVQKILAFTLMQNVTVTAAKAVTANPTGQTIASVSRQAFENSANNNISQAMALIPGVTTIFGNGPRDVFISVRGSNNTSAYGIRNLQIFDDGFPVTDPDGLGRADLIDPHAYGSIDVVQGPSSTLYGNFATGGAIFFHTIPGAEIHGVELGAEEGSFGYLKTI